MSSACVQAGRAGDSEREEQLTESFEPTGAAVWEDARADLRELREMIRVPRVKTEE